MHRAGPFANARVPKDYCLPAYIVRLCVLLLLLSVPRFSRPPEISAGAIETKATASKKYLETEESKHTEECGQMELNDVMESGESESKDAPKFISQSRRAGLVFPVGRVHRYLKEKEKQRVSGNAAVYCTAILEYVVAEVLELAGNACEDQRLKRINPRHIMIAIRTDEELDAFVKATISGGGVLPHIHKKLLAKKVSWKNEPRN